MAPAGAGVSIWRFDNSAKLFRAGYFAGASAPADFTSTGSAGSLPAPGAIVTEAYYVCLTTAATIT